MKYSFSYDEFGNATATNRTIGGDPAYLPTLCQLLTYVGAYGVRNETTATGMFLMGQRWYDATVGRFISQDPIGFNGGLNLYSYANSSPVALIDPNGLAPGSEVIFTGLVIAGTVALIASGVGTAAGIEALAVELGGGLEGYGIALSAYAPEVGTIGTIGVSILTQNPIGPEVGEAMTVRSLFPQGLPFEMIPDPFGPKINLSVSRWGHTFTTHGQNATPSLMGRCVGMVRLGKMPDQGQFLNDQMAAELILENLSATRNVGQITIALPEGFPARVIIPGGTVPATQLVIVPSGKGVKTSFPIR